MKRYRILFAAGIYLLFVAGCGKKEDYITDTESTNETVIDLILAEKGEYQEYTVDVVYLEKDHTYVYLLASPDSDSEDDANYCVDIWIGDGNFVGLYLEKQYILPDTYGLERIGEDEFFRFDLAYEAESKTVLVETEDGICEDTYFLPGVLTYRYGNNFNVEVSALDMEADTETGIGSGRTQKEYYFYIDESGYREYTAKRITEEEFLTYGGAEDILLHLGEAYGSEEKNISYEFMLRSNRYLHINILSVEDGMVCYRYETYLYQEEMLRMTDSGPGRYLESIDK